VASRVAVTVTGEALAVSPSASVATAVRTWVAVVPLVAGRR
jgi:hypothetical protein